MSAWISAHNSLPILCLSLFPLIDLFALACAHHSVSAFAISLHISAVTVFIGVSFAFSTLHALLHSFTLYLCLFCAAFCLFSFSQFSLTQFLWPPANWIVWDLESFSAENQIICNCRKFVEYLKDTFASVCAEYDIQSWLFSLVNPVVAFLSTTNDLATSLSLSLQQTRLRFSYS